jgi:hypothetical protein
MKTAENISTPDLHAYLNIIDNLNTSNQQLANSIGEMHQKNPENLPIKEIQPILNFCKLAYKDHVEISIQLQKVIDSRMKRDLGIVYGIRKTQSLFQKFEDLIAQKEREDNDNAAKKIHQLKIAKEDVGTSNK